MKKKKIIYLTLILSVLIIPEIVNAKEYIICGEDGQFPYVFVDLISKFFKLIKIVIPILLVISGMISFLKVTYSNNTEDELKKAKSKLISNIIAAAIIFFIISIVNFAVGLVAGKNNKFMNCINCFINPEQCEKIEIEDGDLQPGFINKQEENQ